MSCKAPLFIDIDGVISLWGTPERQRSDGVWTLVDGSPHFLSDNAARTLISLQDVFEPVWCTGWQDRANDMLPGLLGLGPWPWVDLDGHARGAGTSVRAHWKLGAVERYADGRPLAWIDDAVDDEVRAWAASRARPTLIVETPPHVGLTEADGETLRAFAASLGG